METTTHNQTTPKPQTSECMSYDDIKTREDGKQMLRAMDDPEMLLAFYDALLRKGRTPREAFDNTVYCFGLDLV